MHWGAREGKGETKIKEICREAPEITVLDTWMEKGVFWEKMLVRKRRRDASCTITWEFLEGGHLRGDTCDGNEQRQGRGQDLESQ